MDNSGNAPFTDGLFIDWHLLDGLNHQCEYSCQPKDAENETFEPRILLDRLYYLLELNRPEYIFHFYGGEPTIHPFFPDLVRTIAASGRNAHIILDTNGIRGQKYFAALLANTPPAFAAVNLEVHLNSMELASLLYVIATITQKRNACRIIINYVPAFEKKARIFCEKLALLRKTIPFLLEIRNPLGTAAPWEASFLEAFKNISTPPMTWPQWGYISGKENNAPHGLYACMGINACHIDKRGFTGLGLSCADFPFTPCVMRSPDMLPGLPMPPAFADKAAARTYLRDFERRAIRYYIEGSPLKTEPGNDSAAIKRLLSALRHLQAVNKSGDMRAYPDLLNKRMDDILRAYDLLADDSDTTVFLGRLKAQLLGDASWLRVDPQTTETNGEQSATESTPPRFDASSSISGLNEFFWRSLWQKAPVEIILPDDAGWLDILLEARSVLPDYKLSLAQEGLSTILRATPDSLPMKFMDADGINTPLLSIIMFARDNADDLIASLESMLPLSDYQAIIIFDENSLPLATRVNEYIQSSGWKIRPVFINGYATFSEANTLGLELAQGRYTLFMECGDTLDAENVSKAVTTMETGRADIALETVSLPETVYENETLLKLLLDGIASPHLNDKIYRSAILAGHNVSPDNFQKLLASGSLNFAYFHFARKAMALPDSIMRRKNSQIRITDWLAWLNITAHFCVAHDIPLIGSPAGLWIASQFMRGARGHAAAIRNSGGENAADLPLDNFALKTLFKNTRSAHQIYDKVRANLENMPQERNFRLNAACSCEPRQAGSPNPLLTVVLIVEHAGQLQNLAKYLTLASPQMEFLLMDNTGQKKTGVELAYLADTHAHTRAAIMECAAHPAVCANHGLKLAQGKYVLMEDGLNPDPTLISTFGKAVTSMAADIIALGVNMAGGNIKGVQYLEACFEQDEQPHLGACAFERHFLTANTLAFDPHAPDWKNDLLLRALMFAKVTVIPAEAYIEQEDPSGLLVHGEWQLDSLGIYDKLLDQAKIWNPEARSNMEHWLGENLTRLWLAQKRGDLRAAPLPPKTASLLWKTLLAKYAGLLENET